ncbi:MAG: hypothetical protein WB766_24000 [Roseiarcus sp.]
MTSSAVALLSIVYGPTRATPVADHEFVTASQVVWGDTPTPFNFAGLLVANYAAVYAPSDLFEIGIPGPTGFSIIWSNTADLLTFLPSSGAPAALDADLVDPTSSSAGSFAGEVAALKLNIDFSDAGLLAHPASVTFGDLELVNFSGALSGLDGLSVLDLLGQVNVLLGGGATGYTINDVFETLDDVNASFNEGGAATSFAEDHLEYPPVAVPEPATWLMALVGWLGVALFGWKRSLYRRGAKLRLRDRTAVRLSKRKYQQPWSKISLNVDRVAAIDLVRHSVGEWPLFARLRHSDDVSCR